ncbi:hypothetical protein [Sphingomonas bisphenolicum]|uniref:Uncharacterized protein n=1 Tax=Sphingomonas bisphenolicum TaxID=296544 RepID=A0ABM7FX41_9SPHN|nr:hypothetical protein [Sphingomonas bisphenolicum]BBF69679.1 hypothetical protein SBA_ch1_18790 [Sphingomonas bisphenolicum]
MAAESTIEQGVRSMGHMALHYKTPDEGPVAARLLTMLGYVLTQDLVLPSGAHFYRFVVDASHRSRGDGIIYLSVLPDAQRDLMQAIHDALHVGTGHEHPAVAALRAKIDEDPEFTFHYGTLLESLEDLEQIFLALEDANANDPELKGRLKLVYNRPLPGDAEVDAWLDASPIYRSVNRYAYGKNGVQAFVETDLLSSGMLGETLMLEFDYIFPDRANHLLSVVEWQ